MEAPTYSVRPLDESTWPAFAALVERNNGIFGGCWCMGFHPEGVGKDTTAELNRDRKLARVRAGTAHAALVFDGDDCLGWCQFGMYNQVAVFRSDAFGRGEADWGSPGELEQRFSACCAHVRESTPLLGRDNRWPMYDRLPIPTWVKGPIALLGDAAHPMLQYLAQGGCQAIEDAAALAAALERHDDGGAAAAGASIEVALLAYQDARAPRTARVQRSARTWGEIWHLDGTAKLVRDELFRQRRDDDHTHVEWLYGRDAPGPAAAAV
jgi:2-polyprenyl-6-methoxyphenol hydroxylase-like FAD-dependent oxidoreductase